MKPNVRKRKRTKPKAPARGLPGNAIGLCPGCLAREKKKAAVTTHGHTLNGKSSPTYKSWDCMRQRCNNPKATSYAEYGGRGIKVCKAWAKFEVFLKDMGERPEGTTLDRLDPDGNYEKSNCRWADPKTQAANKRKPTKWCLTHLEWCVPHKNMQGPYLYRHQPEPKRRAA